jgi:phenylalanyl-tRNA synthetase alpha chain
VGFLFFWGLFAKNGKIRYYKEELAKYIFMPLTETLLELQEAAKQAFAEAKNAEVLEAAEQHYLGRKGQLAEALKNLATLSLEEKRAVGPLANQIKTELTTLAEARREELLAASAKKAAADVTIPVYPAVGHLHPITHIERQVRDIFGRMGFSVYRGPELEEARYNFDALNFPKDHPARDMQDTFWVTTGRGKADEYVMRTHTSPGQVRFMKKNKPPFRVIIPGKVYRNEATDATHEHTFHQFECLMVDEAGEVTIATFKYLAETFFREFFGKKVSIRLRPSFFPFTEPSFEFDISCMICGSKKQDTPCSTCRGAGWIEIGGAGMVHQNVLEAAGYPRGKYQGFAWGFGLTRLALMKYGINDIRLLMSGDVRFLEQF